MSDIRRGDVFYVTRGTQIGSEQSAGRPAIIVSNNVCNDVSPVVEVVYLTTQAKTELPTHCTILSTQQLSTALCEQVHSVYKDRLDAFLCTITDAEMAAVDRCLLVSLGLTLDETSQSTGNPEPEQTQQVSLPTDCDYEVIDKDDYITLKTERDFFEKQYNKLLTKIMKAGGIA